MILMYIYSLFFQVSSTWGRSQVRSAGWMAVKPLKLLNVLNSSGRQSANQHVWVRWKFGGIFFAVFPCFP